MNPRNPSLPPTGFHGTLATTERTPSLPHTRLHRIATRYPLTVFLILPFGVAYLHPGQVAYTSDDALLPG